MLRNNIADYMRNTTIKIYRHQLRINSIDDKITDISNNVNSVYLLHRMQKLFGGGKPNTSDYMLKTEVVPPVCSRSPEGSPPSRF